MIIKMSGIERSSKVNISELLLSIDFDFFYF